MIVQPLHRLTEKGQKCKWDVSVSGNLYSLTQPLLPLRFLYTLTCTSHSFWKLMRVKGDLYFHLAPLCEPLLTARAPSQTDEAFKLDAFAIVLFFEMTGGDEE